MAYVLLIAGVVLTGSLATVVLARYRMLAQAYEDRRFDQAPPVVDRVQLAEKRARAKRRRQRAAQVRVHSHRHRPAHPLA